MTVFEIVETVVYNVEAETVEDAEEVFCTLDAEELRDRFMAVTERTIEPKR